MADILGAQPEEHKDLKILSQIFEKRIVTFVGPRHCYTLEVLRLIQHALETKDKKAEAELVSLVISQWKPPQYLDSEINKSHFFDSKEANQIIVKQCQGILLEAQRKYSEAKEIYFEALEIQRKIRHTTEFQFKTNILISRVWRILNKKEFEMEAKIQQKLKKLEEIKKKQITAREVISEGETKLALEIMENILEDQIEVYYEEYLQANRDIALAEINSRRLGNLPNETKASELLREKEQQGKLEIENNAITTTDLIFPAKLDLPDVLGCASPPNEDLKKLSRALQTRIRAVGAGHWDVLQALRWLQRSLKTKDKKREAELISLVISQLELLQEFNKNDPKSSEKNYVDPIEKETILKQCQGVLLEAQGKLCEAMELYFDALQIQNERQLFPTTDTEYCGGFPFKTQDLISHGLEAQETNLKVEREATDGIAPELIEEMKLKQTIANDLKLQGETELALDVLKILLEKQNQVYAEDHFKVQETKKEIQLMEVFLEFQKKLLVEESGN